ncbi:MAG TPA: nucleotidyltransferase domain-containing protein [Candidatus Ozemobacteraceae bacterium]|nr:nucleotidyltransferase domain-containing protein [Candidatus Ozemobacteraceae bacterium]
MNRSLDVTKKQGEILAALLKRFLPGTAVWAYGSRVKGTARPYSDLDLVVFATPEQRSAVADLKEALDESDLPFIVDLHVWGEIPARFHEMIRQAYVILAEGQTPSNDEKTTKPPLHGATTPASER